MISYQCGSSSLNNSNNAGMHYTNIDNAIGASGLSIIGFEYVTNFRDLWTLMAFKSQIQQQNYFQSSFNAGIVNCTYIVH